MSEFKTLNMDDRNIEKKQRRNVTRGREKLVLGEQYRLSTKMEVGQGRQNQPDTKSYSKNHPKVTLEQSKDCAFKNVKVTKDFA